MKMAEPQFFLKAGVILDRSPAWELALYDVATDGKGDCIFRTAHFAMIKNDYRFLTKCWELCYNRRRWPEDLDDPRGRKYDRRKKKGFRSMTRDPYIMFFCACKEMDRIQLIESVTVPWYTNRPSLKWWRRYLITGKEKHLKRYEWWDSLELAFFRLPSFALYLNCWMAYVAKSKKMMERYQSLCPSWNYMLYQLTLHPLRYLHHGFVEAFKAGDGFVWQADHYHKRELLPEDAEYKLDQGILMYIYNVNQTR